MSSNVIDDPEQSEVGGASDNWTPGIYGGDEMGKRLRAGDDSEWRNLRLANKQPGSSNKPQTHQVVKDGIGEADQAILKLAGVYK
jgi:hypothetical protein